MIYHHASDGEDDDKYDDDGGGEMDTNDIAVTVCKSYYVC